MKLTADNNFTPKPILRQRQFYAKKRCFYAKTNFTPISLFYAIFFKIWRKIGFGVKISPVDIDIKWQSARDVQIGQNYNGYQMKEEFLILQFVL